MRLGQLARRLEINAKDVVTFLEKEHAINITNHPNSKIPDSVLDAVLDNFKPSPIEEMNKALSDESTAEHVNIVDNPENDLQTNQPETQKVTEEQASENHTTTLSLETQVENEEEEESKPESEEKEEEEIPLNIVDGVIKAPKVEIGGIKVIGKIELPEPKKIDDTEVESEENTINTDLSAKDEDKVETDKPVNKPSKTKPKQTHPSLTKKKRPSKEELEARRIAKAEKEKQQEAERLKAKKRAHYQEQLAIQQAGKPKAKKKPAPRNKKNKKKADRPTSLWGKFIYWLNDK